MRKLNYKQNIVYVYLMLKSKSAMQKLDNNKGSSPNKTDMPHLQAILTLNWSQISFAQYQHKHV